MGLKPECSRGCRRADRGSKHSFADGGSDDSIYRGLFPEAFRNGLCRGCMLHRDDDIKTRRRADLGTAALCQPGDGRPSVLSLLITGVGGIGAIGTIIVAHAIAQFQISKE